MFFLGLWIKNKQFRLNIVLGKIKRKEDER